MHLVVQVVGVKAADREVPQEVVKLAEPVEPVGVVVEPMGVVVELVPVEVAQPVAAAVVEAEKDAFKYLLTTTFSNVKSMKL